MSKAEERTASVIGALWQLIPSAYMAITGTVPAWAQWAFLSWLSLWALLVVVKATK